MGADQPHTADRCMALGTARVLDPVKATPEMVREAAAAVLADASYRQAAGQMAAAIAAQPGPAQAVQWLEDLVSPR